MHSGDRVPCARWCLFLFKGVTHDRSPGQKIHPFSRGFKYICSNFDPFFYMKTGTNYPLKTNLFLPFQVHFYKITLFLYISRTHKRTSFLLPAPKFNRKSYIWIHGPPNQSTLHLNHLKQTPRPGATWKAKFSNILGKIAHKIIPQYLKLV